MKHTKTLLGFGLVLAALGVTQVAADRRAPSHAQRAPQLPVALVESVISRTPTVSADGRFVAYAGDNTVWLKDRTDQSVSDLMPTNEGLKSIRVGETLWPVISADGCTVTIITELALDLFRDDDLGDRWDVYRTLLPHCNDGDTSEWELVSATGGSGVGFDVTASDDVSPLYPPAVSADGNTVAYTHALFPAAKPTAPTILGVTVVDLTIAIGQTGRAVPVAGTPTTAPESTYRYYGLREPSISADGLVLAFSADIAVDTSDNALATWGIGVEPGAFATSHVYVWDRGAASLSAISTVGTGATGDATNPVVSGNGQVVAFVSTASNLVPDATLPPCGTVCLPQVYLFDRASSEITLVSREASKVAAVTDAPEEAPDAPEEAPVAPVAAIAANNGATQPALSFDGEEVLFVSRSTNLFPTRSLSVGDATDGDIVLAIPSLGTIDRVSVLGDGMTPAPAANSHPKISALGRVVVFDTLAGASFGGLPAQGRQVAIVEHAPVVSLANLDVGTVAVGFPGPEWFLVLTNTGPSTFLPASAEVSGEDATDFLISGGSCIGDPTVQVVVIVPPGGTCTIKFLLMPSEAGDRHATLTVSESPESLNPVSVSADLAGRGGEPSLAPTPAGGYAGSILVGTNSEPLTFTMSNVAFGTTRIRTVSITGTNANDFHVTNDACTDESLDAATTCDLQVIFTPVGGGRRSAQVVVTTSDGGYATMLLSGDGFYDPEIYAVRSTIPAGSRLQVRGSGFAPNTTITLSWADGSGATTTTVTNEVGELNAQIVVRATDRAGLRTLVAQGPVESGTDQVAATEVLIIPPGKGPGPNSPAWPGP